MKIPENKLKVFTKQIYNHIIDEYGHKNEVLTPQLVYNMITHYYDDILKLLTSRMDPDTKRAMSFMVYLFSENKNLDEIVKYVLDNYTYVEVIHYDNFDYKVTECPECSGRGNETCDDCDGSGREDCNRCDGSTEIKCGDCDGTGEIDGETCDECIGYGNIDCPDCEGEGYVKCSSCDGEGELECSYCDGNGQIGSDNEYFDKYVGFIVTISPDVRDLPNNTILTDEQANTLVNSKIISRLDFDSSEIDEYEPMAYKGDGSGTDMWVIEYKEIGI